jgi:hypothetical protein
MPKNWLIWLSYAMKLQGISFVCCIQALEMPNNWLSKLPQMVNMPETISAAGCQLISGSFSAPPVEEMCTYLVGLF